MSVEILVLDLDSLSKALCAGQHSMNKPLVCRLIVLFHKSTYIPYPHGLKFDQVDIFVMESLNLT